jgi:hypothetical protein
MPSQRDPKRTAELRQAAEYLGETFLEYIVATLLGQPERTRRAQFGESYWHCPLHPQDGTPSFHTLPRHPDYPDYWKCLGCGLDVGGDEYELLRRLREVGDPAVIKRVPEVEWDFGQHHYFVVRQEEEYLARANLNGGKLYGGGGDGGSEGGGLDGGLDGNGCLRPGHTYSFPPLRRLQPPPGWPRTVDHAREQLREPWAAPVRAHLADRGLNPATVRRARFGTWNGHLLIPWYDRGGTLVTAVNTRRLDGRPPRYRLWPGSRRAGVYPGWLVDPWRTGEVRPVMVCEGEVDTILALQELGHWLVPFTLGSVGVGLPLPLVAHLRGMLRRHIPVYIALDGDESGDRGAAELLAQLPGATRLRPDTGKDLTEVHAAEGLRNWFQRKRREEA